MHQIIFILEILMITNIIPLFNPRKETHNKIKS
jgi:hypothetical protein